MAIGGSMTDTTQALSLIHILTFKLYPDCRHELLNELDRRTVFADIAGWLAAHLPQ